MTIPAIVGLGLKYGPALYSVGRSLLSGKSRRQTNLERLEGIASGKLPPGVLDRISGVERNRIRGLQAETASRLRRAGIRPGSPIFEEHMAALQRSEGGLVGQQTAAMREQALGAINTLSSQAPDRSTADLIGELLPSLADDLSRIGKKDTANAGVQSQNIGIRVPQPYKPPSELSNYMPDYLRRKGGGY